MARLSTSPESVSPTEPASAWVRPTLDSVRREFRRSRKSPTPERWGSRRLNDQLPRVALHDALEILLGWRGDPRFDGGAVAWHARLAGHAPYLTLDDAERALTALKDLGGSSPDGGALELGALCQRHGLAEAEAVLDDWLAVRQSSGGF
jgi:hypothetical protein